MRYQGPLTPAMLKRLAEALSQTRPNAFSQPTRTLSSPPSKWLPPARRLTRADNAFAEPYVPAPPVRVQHPHRSAVTGKFVTPAYAARHPRTTERDSVTYPAITTGPTCVQYRDVIRGHLVTEAYALSNPFTTVSERVPVRR